MTMTTSPDTLNAAEATTSPARLAATIADQATSPTVPATGGPIGRATRTQARPTRPDLVDKPNATFQRVLVGVFVAVPFVALVAAIPLFWGWGLGCHDGLL